MTRLKFLFIFILVLLLVPCTNSNPQETSEISRILRQARQLISENRIIDALELFEEVSIGLVMIDKNPISQEEFLWERAMLYLDFANQLTNRNQYIEYAKRAHSYWCDYIGWYDDLSPEDREKLGNWHIRIKKATAHLGNSTIRMEEPILIFEDYPVICKAEDLGVDAIKLWKHWLYACPEMIPVNSSERTAELRRRKICNVNCTDHWLCYAEILYEWAELEDLRPSVRNLKQKEARQIEDAAKTCNNW